MKFEKFKVGNDPTIEFDILFSFDNEEDGNSYIVYTDHSKDENGGLQVYASRLDSTGDETNGSNFVLSEVPDSLWPFIENIIEELNQPHFENTMSEDKNNFADIDFSVYSELGDEE